MRCRGLLSWGKHLACCLTWWCSPGLARSEVACSDLHWLGVLLFLGQTAAECARQLACLQVLAGYPAAEVVWLQEEPENMGAWRFAKPRLDTAMRELLPPHERPAELPTLRYVGRPAAASPGVLARLLSWDAALWCVANMTGR